MIEPLAEYNLELGNVVGVARGVQWWNPGTPIYCKLVNTCSKPSSVQAGLPVAKAIALNTKDIERVVALFQSLAHSPQNAQKAQVLLAKTGFQTRHSPEVDETGDCPVA
ncbi:unnamed protein product [Choristocarpus tenellus]